MLTKTVNASGVKATATGEVRALVSVYDNVDRVGDIVKPGAFDAWIRSMQRPGAKAIPLVWNHRHDDPSAYVGDVLSAKSTAEGLVIGGQFDMATESGRAAAHAVMTGRVKDWSFAYRIDRGAKNAHGGQDLYALTVLEVGPCFVGVNPLARTLEAKGHTHAPAADDRRIGWASAAVDFVAAYEAEYGPVSSRAKAAMIAGCLKGYRQTWEAEVLAKAATLTAR